MESDYPGGSTARREGAGRMVKAARWSRVRSELSTHAGPGEVRDVRA